MILNTYATRNIELSFALVYIILPLQVLNGADKLSSTSVLSIIASVLREGSAHLGASSNLHY